MLNLKPHKTANDQSGISRVVGVNPYIRISAAEEYKNAAGKVCYRKSPVIFLQGGHYYSEDGKPVIELPEWAKSEVAKISPSALSDAGFYGKAEADVVEVKAKRKYVRKVVNNG